MKKFILLIYMFLLKISKSTLTSSYLFMYPYEVIKLFFFVWGGGCGLLFAAVLMSGHIQPINARNLTALHALKCGNLLCVELFFFLCNLGDIPCNVTI